MRAPAKQLCRDALLLAVLGGVVGLIANAISPRGLSLTRDYFPTATAVKPAEGAATARPPETLTKAEPNATQAPATDKTPALSKRGLPLLSHDAAVALFHDPRYTAGLIVFIDARNEEHYAEGHIPGAYEFDHYHPENYMASVLGAAPLAEKIVVYCTGGDCEDSELATLDLISLGIPREKLVIYGGGITEWEQKRMPIETGSRGSRKIQQP